MQVDHQRRARADVDVVGDRPRCSSGTSGPTGSTRTTIRRRPIACWTFPTRSCGRRARRCATFLFNFIRERARHALDARSTSAPRASSPPARCSISNTLTIGFARRFTGYKRPELIFPDPDRLARILNAPGRAGADRLRRQGASGRRRRQASPAAHLPARARSEVRRPHRASSTTTTCTSRTSSCRAATSG